MANNEAMWRSKSDEDIFDAARHLNDYTEDGRQFIQNEMSRRRMMVDEPASIPRSGVMLTEPAPTSRSSGRDSRSPVVDRYQDAYRVGTALVGLGVAIKVIGLILAALFMIAAIGPGKGALGGVAVLAGGILAAVTGGLFWIFGVIVAAQGQILRATLDTAVAGSPFMNDAQRLEAMGLPTRRAL